MNLASAVATHPIIAAAAVGGVAALVYRELFCVDKPKLFFKDSERNERLVAQLTELQRHAEGSIVRLLPSDVLLSGYKYPIWGHIPHLQTLYASAVRWAPRESYRRFERTDSSVFPNLTMQRFREEVISHDGGVVVLDWFETEELQANRTDPNAKLVTVVIVPGTQSEC